jgi:sulfite oxidase
MGAPKHPLSRDHGAPLRLVVPGYVGARSVKWVHHVSIRPSESCSVWQQRYYRVFPPWVTSIRDIDYDERAAPPVYAFPVQSAIVTPTDGESVRPDADGTIAVGGYAVSGAGQRVVSVRLSTDGGARWTDAALQHTAGSPDAATPPTTPQEGRHWSWVLWSARVPLPAGATEVRLCCKATDSAYNSQPEVADYNLRGYLSNAWSKVILRAER